MQTLKTILEVISGIAGCWMTFLVFYQLCLSFFGFHRKTKDYADHEPESRFLVLVPAHNEGKVIGEIVRNLQSMDYPKELYDFYIIADNCTDNTAEIARNLGANVIETQKDNPDAPTGKPIALKKALDVLSDYDRRYDMMMIFDADNLMDTNMFREVNSQFLDKGKPELIQCYLGVKNNKGIVAWFDYTAFTLNNRFFSLAKHHAGLNATIGGTGYAISTAYLRQRGGWTNHSLTEDFEIQVEATITGKRILWNHTTRVYDEKPTDLRTSIRQKIRWGQGYWYVITHNMKSLFRALFSGTIRFTEFLSTFTHMSNITAYPSLLLQMLCQAGITLINGRIEPLNFTVVSTVYSILMITYSYLFLFYVAEWLDNRIPFAPKRLPYLIGGFFINMFACFCNQMIGLLRFRDQGHWVKTEHHITCGKTETLS